jgi:hypothetical protein
MGGVGVGGRGSGTGGLGPGRGGGGSGTGGGSTGGAVIAVMGIIGHLYPHMQGTNR